MMRVNLLLGLIVLQLYSPIMSASPIVASTIKTNQIIGHMPYINSITALIDEQNNHAFQADTNQPILTTGSSLFIPTQLCVNSINGEFKERFPFLDSTFFQFLDADDDPCEITQNQIEWFILEPQSGDWSSVEKWDDLITTPISINETPDAFLPPEGSNLPTLHPILKLPAAAEGKRVGFIYTPVAKTGVPKAGLPIKVWDLSYFFKQSPPNIRNPQADNEGTKGNLVPVVSAGGAVQKVPLKAQISNIKLTGKLSQGEQLDVAYQFDPQTENVFEDISIFCWGEPNTTKVMAQNRDSSCSESPLSPIISLNDLQNGLELSIRSVKKENNINIWGDIYTTNAFEHDEIYAVPQIDDIAFFYYSTDSTTPPENGSQPGHTLGGSYAFLAGSNLIDTSTLAWHINDEPAHESKPTNPADIINNKLRGGIPSYRIREADIGNILKLVIHPKDGNQRQGPAKTQDVWQPSPPTVDNLQFVGNFFVGNEMIAEYDWRAGKNGNRSDRSSFVWQTPAAGIIEGQIDDSAIGNGRKSTAMDLFQTGTIATKSTNGIYTIQAGDVGGTVKFILTARDGANQTGNTKEISHYLNASEISTKKPPILTDVIMMSSATGATQQIKQPSYAYIMYYYSPGENRDAIDETELVWYLPDGSIQHGKIRNPSRVWSVVRRTNNNLQSGKGIYVLQPEDLGKILKIEITPVDSDGVRGVTKVLQNEIVYEQADSVAPKISNLKINVQGGSEPMLGTALYGTYDYTEGRGFGWGRDMSAYQWRGVNTVTGRVQEQGRTPAYIVRLDDVGQTVSLKVTADSEVLGPVRGNTIETNIDILSD